MTVCVPFLNFYIYLSYLLGAVFGSLLVNCVALRCIALHTSVVVCACVLACLVSMPGKEARDTDSTCPTTGKKGKQSQLSNMYPAYPLDVIRFGETEVRVSKLVVGGIRVNACG